MADSREIPSKIEKQDSSLGDWYFNDLYCRAQNGDPWNFVRSPYEQAKYATTLAQLPKKRYRSSLEVGCSVGVFTRLLAERVDRLLAIDLSELALEQASSRCADHAHCEFRQLDLMQTTPRGPFDLIVLAEVAYYWTQSVFERLFRSLCSELTQGGQIILVHWREQVPDYPLTGDDVHRLASELEASVGLRHLSQLVKPEYRIDVWERESP